MLILFNKPYNVLCQFKDKDGRKTLSDYIPIKKVYAAGRLDFDSEGLLILTDNGKLQNYITDPNHKLSKTYWVQVEGNVSAQALEYLKNGIKLKDGLTSPAKVKPMEEPNVWERIPQIRFRKNIPTSWIEITINEGRNRQIRRMTAAVNYPTLRLIRYSIGDWNIKSLLNGEYRIIKEPI